MSSLQRVCKSLTVGITDERHHYGQKRLHSATACCKTITTQSKPEAELQARYDNVPVSPFRTHFSSSCSCIAALVHTCSSVLCKLLDDTHNESASGLIRVCSRTRSRLDFRESSKITLELDMEGHCYIPVDVNISLSMLLPRGLTRKNPDPVLVKRRRIADKERPFRNVAGSTTLSETTNGTITQTSISDTMQRIWANAVFVSLAEHRFSSEDVRISRMRRPGCKPF
jgi:hypothetical protein